MSMQSWKEPEGGVIQYVGPAILVASEGVACATRLLQAAIAGGILTPCIILWLIQSGAVEKLGGMIGQGLRDTSDTPARVADDVSRVGLKAEQTRTKMEIDKQAAKGAVKVVNAAQDATIAAISLQTEKDHAAAGLPAREGTPTSGNEIERFEATFDGQTVQFTRIKGSEDLFERCDRAISDDPAVKDSITADNEGVKTGPVGASSNAENVRLFIYTDFISGIRMASCTTLDKDGQQQKAVYAVQVKE